MGRRHRVPEPPDTDERPGDAGDQMSDPESVARSICLQQLTRRARSRSELADVLRDRGVPEEPAARVLDRFVEVGLIDDAALAENLALGQHRERGLARRAVVAKLRQRGLDADTVDAAVAVIDTDSERAAAQNLVARRLRSLAGLPPQVQTRRLVGLLARKGYSPGLAFEVVRSAVRDLDGDGEAGVDPGD